MLLILKNIDKVLDI